MSNDNLGKFFEGSPIAGREEEVSKVVFATTGFQPDELIFQGTLLDKTKVGSLIYRGSWQGKTAVLKIQGLKPAIEEVEIIKKFKEQSSLVRAPEVYLDSPWEEARGYGYFLMEFIDQPVIYQEPFATDEQITDFCRFYEEYKTKATRQPFFPPTRNEENSLVFNTLRVSHWSKIGESKGLLSEKGLDYLSKYIQILAKQMPTIKMEFQHGHLTANDIRKDGNAFIVTANMYWSYRPEYYDLTFHLWAGIKSIRDLKIDLNYVINYITKWADAYRKMPILKDDTDFDRKFAMAMLERCIGPHVIGDIEEQNFPEGQKDEMVKHLHTIFEGIFDHYTKTLI